MQEQQYKVYLTEYCTDALRNIALGIAIDLSEPEAAKNWLQKMRKHIFGLDTFPARVPLTPEEPWHSLGLRRLTVGKYYVYFLVFQDQMEVRVTDVIYQGMEQARQLSYLPVNDLVD